LFVPTAATLKYYIICTNCWQHYDTTLFVPTVAKLNYYIVLPTAAT